MSEPSRPGSPAVEPRPHRLGGTDPAVQRARVLLLGLFGLLGVAVSSWLARIPTLRDLLDLSTGDLGVILLIGSVGALLCVTFAGVIVTRYGSRVGIVASTLVFAVGYVLMGIGPQIGSLPLLAVGVFLQGCSMPLGNVPLNVESARIERAIGRTVIPQFHAMFSIGAVLGSSLGAVASHAQVPVAVQFSTVAAVFVIWRLASLRGVVLAQAPGDAPGASRAAHGRRPRLGGALGAWREPRTLLIGVVIMAASLSEGAANDWLSLAVVDGFARTEAVGGVVLGVFVGSMTVVRLLGTRLIDRFGRVVVLRASGLVSIAGLLLFGLAPSFLLAGLGVAAWGFGAALAVPIGIAAASDDPVRAAARVAVVSSFASVASIAAPPLLGLAAEVTGARHALLLITAAMVASVAFSGRVARETPTLSARGAEAPDGAAVPAPRSAEPDAGRTLPTADTNPLEPAGAVRR
ncbi:MFS transporter [Cellulomonas soli]